MLLKAIFMLYRLPESERVCSGICTHMFEWIEMEIAKNREEYGLIKTDLSKQKIEDKKS